MKSVLRIPVRIGKIRLFLGLPDPAPDLDLDPDPDPSIIKHHPSLWLFSLKNDVNGASKSKKNQNINFSVHLEGH